ncbi:BadF/BadG/BcrA/BcrD ATPase family protein, partial [Pantoea sp.]|uniref:BadF/BadG/BcrA/BcrD ATPase family protein n=1 Tax=Pantoea sp. TaxID=69393 RepID=UPI002897D0F9
MQTGYLLGIDGGGTRCRARLTDRQGKLLAEVVGGPANVWSRFDDALATVEGLMREALRQAGLPTHCLAQTSAAAGLAGANVASVKARLDGWRSPCRHIALVTDVEIACMGAHQGEPGAVFIVGTGSQGAAWDGQRFSLLGGWGFALSDLGSGAELGRRALRLALLAHEGVAQASPLTQAIMARFDRNPETMLLWSQQATPADWGEVVPEVFAAANAGDAQGRMLVQQTADDIALMV